MLAKLKSAAKDFVLYYLEGKAVQDTMFYNAQEAANGGERKAF
jgi:hypothetical protein